MKEYQEKFHKGAPSNLQFVLVFVRNFFVWSIHDLLQW